MAREEDPVSEYLMLDASPVDVTDLFDTTTDVAGISILEPQQSVNDIYLVGFVIANIVGIQYYSGAITGRELVALVREPLNPYDPCAIQVINRKKRQVGYIERSVSSVLSPLVDECLISIEGIVPNRPGGNSSDNQYKIPCQVHIFSTFQTSTLVADAISSGGLQLISEAEASFGFSEAVVVREKTGRVDGKKLDEIFKLVEEILEKTGPMDVMEPPKEVIKSELFLHQKEGLGWLVKRENSDELPPFWVEKSDGVYVNKLTNHQTYLRPEPIRGGILADDMGLGKTLTLLSLIALDKYGPLVDCDTSSCSSKLSDSFDDASSCNAWIRDSLDDNDYCSGRVREVMDEENDEGFVVFGGKIAQKGRGVAVVNRLKKRQKIGGTSMDEIDNYGNLKGSSNGSFSGIKLKTTLVVCPPSVFSTWITQLGDHTISGKLKVYMYYGERTSDVWELKKYDLVLTTYSTLGIEVTWPDSPMFQMEWWRVILDEAHMIKNVNASQSRAVNKLIATRRWVVTGTPIQNGTYDLFSLMTFLRFQPFSIKTYWTNLVQRPLASGNPKGLLRLQAVMATISLRRTKDNGLVGLPPKILEICYVDLSTEERELYDRMELEAKNVVRNYISANSLRSKYTTVLGIILRLRQICTNVALCPSDLFASLPTINLEDVSNNKELLEKMVSILQDGEDFDCPICISPPTDIVITCCAHIFCKSCILKTLKRAKPCCPLCRRELSESDLFSSPPEENPVVSSSGTSSKVSALLKLLSASRDQNPSTKSIVFSQFRKMLLLLEEPLKAAGFKILRLDGSMNANKRTQVIKEFGVPAPNGPTILLASLKASGTGINLTSASRVYFMEPWWNPAVEEQAMDRVHRIGQTEEVKIVRIIARNSIDERILELQEKKKKLASEAFARKGSSKDRREISIDDLRTLMSL